MCVVHMPQPRQEDGTVSQSKRHDAEKHRYWQRVIREAARSGLSISAFCRQRRLKEPQFYWWQRRLKNRQQERTFRPRRLNTARPSNGQASFALVSDDPEALAAGIELVLTNGRRLRISQGVEEETLRTVLAVLEADRC